MVLEDGRRRRLMMLVENGGMEEDEAELEILNAEGGEGAAVSNGYKMFKLAW